MGFEIQEINGKLYKITSVPIDKYNTRRVSTPLTESEYEKLLGTVQKAHEEELATLEKFSGGESLPKELEVDEREIKATEPVRGKPIAVKSKVKEVRSEVPPKKYRVASD